jgi:hypothetical protein
MLFSKNRTHHTVYRKIYERHYGPIPTDSEGRTYEIHHIDGDNSNNDPKNLVALTIQEHYEVHKSQGDWAACLAMSHRMKISPEEKSELSRKNAALQMKLGLNPIVNLTFEERSNNAKAMNKRRVESGTHNWQNSEEATRKNLQRVKNGTHNLLGRNAYNYDSTVYKFKNLDTGDSVSLTRNDFIKTYGLQSQNVYHMIKGNRKSVKRWVLEP